MPSPLFKGARWPTKSLMAFERVPPKGLDGVIDPDALSKVTGSLKFKFRINPDKLKISRKKIEKFVLTKAGYERQYWNNDLIQLSYSGTTGVFRPDETSKLIENGLTLRDTQIDPTLNLSPADYDIRETYAWKKFEQFEKFYLACNEDEVQLFFWKFPHALLGSINEFEYDLEADNPRIIRYSFRFTGMPDEDRPTLEQHDADYDQLDTAAALLG